MNTIKELLKRDVDRLEIDLNVLLNNYSSIGSRINDDHSDVFFISTSGDRFWKQVSDQGKPLQSKIYKEFNQFADLMFALISNEPKEYIDKFKEYKSNVLECIDQNGLTWHKDTTEAFYKATGSLTQIFSLLDNLYSYSDGKYIFVIDTSAIIYNPDIESWKFDKIKSFSLTIPPTVISELDSYETSNKNETVKAKARKLINKFKEYSRRGKLTEGVPIVKDKITFFTLPQEPDMTNSLPHLDPKNNDDRIFASFVEVIRKNVKSYVTLVSRDFNLQNKANHFSLPVIDPPELTD